MLNAPMNWKIHSNHQNQLNRGFWMKRIKIGRSWESPSHHNYLTAQPFNLHWIAHLNCSFTWKLTVLNGRFGAQKCVLFFFLSLMIRSPLFKKNRVFLHYKHFSRFFISGLKSLIEIQSLGSKIVCVCFWQKKAQKILLNPIA